jgi:hypothetical protein
MAINSSGQQILVMYVITFHVCVCLQIYVHILTKSFFICSNFFFYFSFAIKHEISFHIIFFLAVAGVPFILLFFHYSSFLHSCFLISTLNSQSICNFIVYKCPNVHTSFYFTTFTLIIFLCWKLHMRMYSVIKGCSDNNSFIK